MNVLFYSPFVTPNPDVPSGASRVAVLMQRALARAGCHVTCPALPRTYDGLGSEQVQRSHREASAVARDALLSQISNGSIPRPDAWFSYHVYYKSPDWIGPEVSARLGIPYIVAEGSHAPKRKGGPWSVGHEATQEALVRARLLLAATDFDRFCLEPLIPGRVRDLKPFIDCAGIPHVERSAGSGIRLVAAGMMRNDRKRDSYALLAQALSYVQTEPYSLDIAGDGKFRPEVEACFRAAGVRGEVRFLGALPHADTLSLMARSDLFAWPGIGEAYGISYLEAQACGLPVVACRNRGVTDVTQDGSTAVLCPTDDPQSLAGAIDTLSRDKERRRIMSTSARRFVLAERSLESAAALLRTYLNEVQS